MSNPVDFDLLGREYRQDLDMADLLRVEDLCVVFEGSRKDSDGVRYWVYTVGGRLDGQMIGGKEGGCLVGGQAIFVHGRNRTEADALAYDGLQDTVKFERQIQAHKLLGAQKFDKTREAGIVAHAEMLSKRRH